MPTLLESQKNPPIASDRWLWSGVLLLVFGSIMLAFDATLSEAIGNIAPHGTIQRRIIKQSYRIFAWYSYIVVAAVLIAQSARFRLLLGFGAAVGLGAAIIHGLKYVIGRGRPQLEMGAFHFEPFTFADHLDAFPSGHVGGAVMISVLVGFYYPPLRWPLLFLSAMVALGRVVQDRHFVSDTLAGAGIAILAVYYCYLRLGPAYYPSLASRGVLTESAASVRRETGS